MIIRGEFEFKKKKGPTKAKMANIRKSLGEGEGEGDGEGDEEGESSRYFGPFRLY